MNPTPNALVVLWLILGLVSTIVLGVLWEPMGKRRGVVFWVLHAWWGFIILSPIMCLDAIIVIGIILHYHFYFEFKP